MNRSVRKMLRAVSIAGFMALCFSSTVSADEMKIVLKSGKVIEIPTETIDRIYFENGGGGFPFRVTSEKYSERKNNNYACKSEFGDDYRLASWKDIVRYSEKTGKLDKFLRKVGMTKRYGEKGGLTLHVSYRGDELYSGDRHYFISRHDGRIPGNYLAHDTHANKTIALGSWRGARPALCIKR